jgi:hypothetical protein
MRRARSVAAVFLLLALASTATAQDRESVRLLEKLLVGSSTEINAEIANLRRRLARCDGPANQRLPSDNCGARTLIQAQLNYLLRMGMEFGDPDTAGTRASTPVVPPAPPDAADYISQASILQEKVRSEPPGDIVYLISENRAQLVIIGHCRAMHEYQYVAAGLTDDENRAALSPAGQAKTKADVNACIKAYDAKEIGANRKAAIEYCLQTHNYSADPFGDTSARVLFDTCMNTHDMVQAICKQRSEHAANYMMRKLPGQLRSNQTCPGVQPSPREIQAILSPPAARAMAVLPPKFLAVPAPPPPHPDYPVPAPPVPIPTGTALETILNGQISPSAVERGLGQGVDVPARLERPLVVGGRTVLAPPTQIFVRARIVGPGTGPNSVLIGFTAHWAQKNGDEGGYELKSDEIVFTVARQPPAPAGLNLFVPLDTKLRFTLGSTASSAAPAAGASAATPTAKPTPAPPTASAPPDPRQQAEERRKQAERLVVCQQQAVKDHPRGGVELAQALMACTLGK